MNPLLDTHCHIDGYPDPIDILDQSGRAGVDVIAVTEDPGGYRRLRTRLGRRSGVEVALGWHPLRAAQLAPHDLARFFRLLPQANWIGEIGLDFSRAGVSTQREQLRAFDAILEDPHVLQRPMTVHSRGAERETIALLAQARPGAAILHWYTGPLAAVDDALAAGLWFSINPAMTRSRKASALLPRLPAQRVLLESDGPFARIGRGAATPNDVNHTLRHLSRLWDMSLDQANDVIIANQRRILAAISHI